MQDAVQYYCVEAIFFLAVQDSSIGDLVTHSLSEWVSESGFDFTTITTITTETETETAI